MSRKKTPSSKSEGKETSQTAIYVALFSLIGTVTVAIIVAVSNHINTRTQILLPISLTQTAQVINQEQVPLESTPTQKPYMNGILIAGQVSDATTNEFLNDRLVVLFLKDKEIARTVTSTLKFQIGQPPYNQDGTPSSFVGTDGVSDGVFYLSVPNTYELKSSDLISDYIFPLFSEGKVDLYGNIYDVNAAWLNYVVEEELMDFQVPSKKTHYFLFVFSGKASQLPSKIQAPGSVELLDGYKLVAINPIQPQSTPEPLLTADSVLFSQIYETEDQVSNEIISINNCNGSFKVEQEISRTYIHEFNDETEKELGIKTTESDWAIIVREIEWHYAMSENQISSQTLKLTAMPGESIEFRVVGKKIWEHGKAFVVRNGVETSAFYRILINQTLDVVEAKQKTCP